MKTSRIERATGKIYDTEENPFLRYLEESIKKRKLTLEQCKTDPRMNFNKMKDELSSDLKEMETLLDKVLKEYYKE